MRRWWSGSCNAVWVVIVGPDLRGSGVVGGHRPPPSGERYFGCNLINYMDYQPVSTDEAAISAGLLGCAGGGLLGLFGGALLLALLAFGLALAAPVPALPGSAGPDLRLELHEAFLNRFAQSAAGSDTTQVDILPGSQARLATEVTVSAFGITTPVQVTGLLGMQLTGQSINVRLIDTQVSGLELPPEMSDVFSADLLTLNQDLNAALANISQIMGTAITLTGLGTTDTEVWLEAQAGP